MDVDNYRQMARVGDRDLLNVCELYALRLWRFG